MKHTRGKWTVEPCGELRKNEWLIVSELGRDSQGVMNIRTIGRVFDYAEKLEVEANARLIAAAPDLLAACKTALKFIRSIPPGHSQKRVLGENQLEAAIAKAGGR